MESRIGLIIGHHYTSSMEPAIVSMTKTVCCGLQESSLGRFFSKSLFNEELSIGATVTELHHLNRTAGVAAHVTSSKYICIFYLCSPELPPNNLMCIIYAFI